MKSRTLSGKLCDMFVLNYQKSGELPVYVSPVFDRWYESQLQLRNGDITKQLPGAAQQGVDLLLHFDDAIAFQNPYVLVMAKPWGILTEHLSGISVSLEEIARYHFQNPEIETAHRIDREVSGLVALGKNRDATLYLREQFYRHRVVKIYTALVHGDWRLKQPEQFDLNLTQEIEDLPTRVINTRSSALEIVRAKSTSTRIHQIGLYEDTNHNRYSLMEIQIFTGARHQIRCVCAHFGHYVVGDPFYGAPTSLASHILLNAGHLEIDMPYNWGLLTLDHPRPQDFEAYLTSLHQIR